MRERETHTNTHTRYSRTDKRKAQLRERAGVLEKWRQSRRVEECVWERKCAISMYGCVVRRHTRVYVCALCV